MPTRIYAAKENNPAETRVPVTPPFIEKLVKMGAVCTVEPGIGEKLGIPDSAYREAGAETGSSPDAADIVLRLRKPEPVDVEKLSAGTIHISYLDPFNDPGLVKAMADRGISAVSLEMIPRTTIAQKMDVLSSQANLAGYVSVILAAERSSRIFPMMTTPAGTIAPARVFVIGVGVAGLQAIATAKRLGAIVEAFDTRPVVEEQVKSLGAKFVKIDLGETGQTKDGYARELTPEQIALQQQGMARHCAQADVVITTAQLFGRRAPRIVTADMVRGMKPGSIIVDMAVESGGNVEGSVLDQEVDVNGVTIIGLGNLPGRVAVHASQMYASNLFNFVSHFWDKERSSFKLDTANEIISGCLITHGGEVVHPMIRERINAEKE